MSFPKKRIQLSFLVRKTNKMLVIGLLLTNVVLGSLYLFALNNVAMRGYLLTKEAQKAREITLELERIESAITQHETKDFVVEQSNSSFMVYNDQREFLVYKESYTAQK